MAQMTCPECLTGFSYDDRRGGQKTSCLNCKKPIVLDRVEKPQKPSPKAIASPRPLLSDWASILIGIVFFLLALFTIAMVGVLLWLMSESETVMQQAAGCAFVASLLVAGYCLARCAEKVVRAFNRC